MLRLVRQRKYLKRFTQLEQNTDNSDYAEFSQFLMKVYSKRAINLKLLSFSLCLLPSQALEKIICSYVKCVTERKLYSNAYIDLK